MFKLENNAILWFGRRTIWTVTVFLPVVLFKASGTTAVFPYRLNALP